MGDTMKKQSDHHSSIKTEGKIKVIKGAASAFTKGISLGTSTSIDKHGVGGSWKKNMAGGGSDNG